MVRVPNGFELQRWREEIRAVNAEVDEIAASVTESQFHAPRRQGGWSVGHCLEHLILTGEAFVAAWDRALEEAPVVSRADTASSRYSWWERGALRFMEPPYRLKFRTTQGFAPSCRRSMTTTVERLQHLHSEFTKRAERSRGLDLKRIQVQSPFSAWISYPVEFSFDLAIAHERRHLWQARQVRRLTGNICSYATYT